MGRKRRAAAPAPPPPPPPPQESSSESGSDNDQEEEPPRAAAAQKAPQNPQPRPPAAAADSAESEEEESDSDDGAQQFQMRPVSHSPAKPAAPPPQSESDADDDDEEEGESSESESEPEVPPVQKKAAATKKSKTAEPEVKKRPAPEPAPSGMAKKAKAEVGKAAPEATRAGKGKKAKAEQEKAAPQAPSGKAKNPGGKPEKRGINPSSSSKLETPARAHRTWSKQDAIKILDAMAAHVKEEGALPKNDVLLAAVHDRLDRKNCAPMDLYDKVRSLKRGYDNTSVVPTGEDELQIYNLSDAIWGAKAKEAIAAAAQNDSTVTKSKKGVPKKQKMDGNSKGGTLKEAVNQNGDTQRGSKKGHAIEVKTDRDIKSKLSEEDTTTGTPSKSKQQGNGKKELGKDAKSGTSKDTTTTATQNGDTSTKRKGKMDKDKMDIDPMPKDVATGSQNGGTRTEEEIDRGETGIGAGVQGTHRSFDELQSLYPNLAWCLEMIEAKHPCGETLRRLFGLIDDEKANALESKIKAQRLLEVKENNAQADINKAVLNMLRG